VSEGQGWVVIALLMLLVIGIWVMIVQVEDLQTTVRLVDVACPA